jgi:hypothetical protein
VRVDEGELNGLQRKVADIVQYNDDLPARGAMYLLAIIANLLIAMYSDWRRLNFASEAERVATKEWAAGLAKKISDRG